MTSVINTKKRSSVLAALFVVSFGVSTVSAAKKQGFFERNEQALIGGAIGVTTATILFLINGARISKERAARKELRHYVDGHIGDLRAWLKRLQELYDALPFEQFKKEADEKTAAVRQLLSQDLTKHRDTLAYDVQRVAAEITTLREERDRMVAELDRQRLFLGQVQEFVLSVRDEQGEAFLHNITEAKEDIEKMIGQLRSQRAELANQLADLARISNEYAGTLATQERALSNLQADISSLDATVAQRRSQVEQAHRASQDMDREVERISNALTTSKKQYRSLRSELDQSLGQLAQYISSVRSDKNILDQQVQQAHFLLQDVTTNIMTLQDQSSRASGKLADAMGTDVVATDHAAAPQPRPAATHRSHQSPASFDKEGDSAIAEEACAVLREALSPFGDTATSQECRKAYLKFARSNHPDKGGDAEVFKAIDGLYNAVVGAKLLDKNVSYLPSALSKDLVARINDVRSVVSEIKK